MCILMGAAAYAFPIPYLGQEGDTINRDTLRLVATLLFRTSSPLTQQAHEPC